MNYFSNKLSLEEARKLFKKLSKELHPDIGGNHEDFINMKNEFDNFINNYQYFNSSDDKYTDDEKFEINENLKEVIKKVIHFENIKIEIIGSWIWLTENTYPFKEFLKENKFFFSKSKKAWYWNGKDKKQMKGRYTLNKLRKRFENMEIKTEPQQKLTMAH